MVASRARTLKTVCDVLTDEEQKLARSAVKRDLSPIKKFGYDNYLIKKEAKRTLFSLFRNLKTAHYGKLDSSVFKHGFQINYCETEPVPGDICMGSGYGVSIPADEVLRELCNNFSVANIKNGLERVLEYVEAVNVQMKHIANSANGEKPVMGLVYAFHKANQGKIIRLEDIMRGNLPGVCFEQAIALAVLINRDKELSSIGIKANVALGNYVRLGMNPDYGASHAWVRLSVPKGLEGRGFDHTTYILDPTNNRAYVLDHNALNSERKYQEFSGFADYWGPKMACKCIIRPKQKAI